MKSPLLFLLILLSLAAKAQTEITGKIIEKENQQPLEFAEIILVPNPSGEIVGSITDAEGTFKMKVTPGDYVLQVSYVGQQLYSEDLTIVGKDLDLGTIAVENSQMLGEVVINAKKKLIERKVDRLVFNVAGSSKASEGDVVEVLKITPGIRVENDNIAMLGKGSLLVMIDDKIIRLSGTDLVNFLRSIPSESIERIEVINNPPAKYEASGNSGLVNIVLKQARKNSWNAQLKGTYLQRVYPTWRYNALFNFRKDKLSIAARLYYNHQFIHIEEEVTSNFPQERWHSFTPIDIETEGFLASTDLGYQMTRNWEVGGQFFFNGTRVGVDVQPETRVFDRTTGQETRALRSEGSEPQHPRRYLVNFYNKIDLDSLGKKIILNLDYFRDYNRDQKYYKGVSIDQDTYSKQYYKSVNLNTRTVTNYSAKADVEYPVQWIDVDFGGKLSYLDSQNDISFFNSEVSAQPEIENVLESSDFSYKENIGALYLSANRKFGEKWSAQVGLRMENTQINASSEDSNLYRDEHYTNLFPTFYLSYAATKNSNFSLNYGRRIQRPSFFDLNPSLYYHTPFQAFSGNPFLEPAFIHNVELSNIYKNFVTRLYYSYEDNLFAEIPLPDLSSNTTLFTVENYLNRSRIGFSENYTFDEVNRWTSTNNFDVNYSESRFDLEQEQPDRTGYNARISSYNDIVLNAGKTIIAGLNYWYQFPGVDGIFKTDSRSALGLSLQFLLLQKDLNITLKGNDIFKTGLEHKTAKVNGIQQELRNYYDTRQFWVILSYKFGNKNIKSPTHQTGNEEEKGRI